MQLPGGMTGARAITALPLALRKKLVNRYLSGVAISADEAVDYAQRNSPFYRQFYGSGVRRFLDAPVLTQETLCRAAPETLLARTKDTPAIGIRSRLGAAGYLTMSDLVALGAPALLHPDAGSLLASLRDGSFALNALPYQLSLLAPIAERLVRYLGGCSLNAPGVDDSVACSVLQRERPSVVISQGDELERWLAHLEADAPAAAHEVIRCIQWWLRTADYGPLPPQDVQEREVRLRLRLLQVLTDGFSFLFINCGCGQFHPGPHQLLETVNQSGALCAGEGRLVLTDLARRVMPLVRYDTGLVGVVRSDACPHLGQTLSVSVSR